MTKVWSEGLGDSRIQEGLDRVPVESTIVVQNRSYATRVTIENLALALSKFSGKCIALHDTTLNTVEFMIIAILHCCLPSNDMFLEYIAPKEPSRVTLSRVRPALVL